MMTRMNLEDATTSSEINKAQKKKNTNTDFIHTRTFEYSGSPGDGAGAGVVVHRDSVEGGGGEVSQWVLSPPAQGASACAFWHTRTNARSTIVHCTP